MVAPNHLERQFDVTELNKVWVTDITYIRPHEGWLYLVAVLDLFSRHVIGWSMGPRFDRELAISALLMAVWQLRPAQEVLVHSDQGSQFSSYDWQDFLREHRLKTNMSWRGNYHDNAVAESSFRLLNPSVSISKPMWIVRKPGRMCSITLKCFTTPSADTVSTSGYRQ